MIQRKNPPRPSTRLTLEILEDRLAAGNLLPVLPVFSAPPPSICTVV